MSLHCPRSLGVQRLQHQPFLRVPRNTLSQHQKIRSREARREEDWHQEYTSAYEPSNSLDDALGKEAEWLLDEEDDYPAAPREVGRLEDDGAAQDSSRHPFEQDDADSWPRDSWSREVEDEGADLESREFAVAMANVGWETKAEQIKVLHVAPLVSWCSYMVVLNIKSRPQLQAIFAKMERLAEEKYGRKLDPNAAASRGSEWETLDFIDVVVHIFTEKCRLFYNLDGYYGMAEAVDLPFLKQEQMAVPWAKTSKGL